MSERIVGRVTRWGTRGYGFIHTDALERDAWFHLNFLVDPSYEPREGDIVTFEPFLLDDGRAQARHVRFGAEVVPPARPVSFARTLLSPEDAARLQARIATRSATATPTTTPVAASTTVAAADRPAPTTLDGHLQAVHTSRRADRDRMERDLARLERTAAEADARVEAAARALEAARRVADDARGAVGKSRETVGRFDDGDAAAEASVATAFMDRTSRKLAEALAERQRETDTLLAARQIAIRQNGEDAVAEYKQVRARARSESDPLARKAFARVEAEDHPRFEEYARALDAVESRPTERVAIVAFAPPANGSPQPVTIVLAVPASALDEEPGWRLACAFWRAIAEACGSDVEVERGSVAGCLAARIDPFDMGDAEAELLAFAFDEAWTSRSSLAAWGLAPSFESVRVAWPEFVPLPDRDTDEDDDAPARRLPPAAGGSLRDVARRIDEPLHVVTDVVSGAGLAAPDDTIDAGTEETVRRLLGEVPTEPVRPASAATNGGGAATPAPPRSRAQDVAGRLLAKLLRDRRIGGRHTAIEHAYGHHFADEEKDIAKEIGRRLVGRDILRAKKNEGEPHVFINPRRLADVHRIIEGRYDEPTLYEGL